MTLGINGDSNRPIEFRRTFNTNSGVDTNFGKIDIGIGKPAGNRNQDPLKIESSEPSDSNMEARTELDEKVSSTNMSYANANSVIERIRSKYTDDKYFALAPKGTHNPYLSYDKSDPLERCFNPVKLPEPDRTEYKEAVAAKTEIEHNNPELVNDSGNAINRINEGDAISLFDDLKSNPNETNWLENFTKDHSETSMYKSEKQKTAIRSLNTKTSSTGMTYADAKNKLIEITKEYKDNPDYSRTFTKEKLSWEGFDPYKLPEPKQSEYFNALNALIEIEQENSALVSQAGLNFLEEPEKAG